MTHLFEKKREQRNIFIDEDQIREKKKKERKKEREREREMKMEKERIFSKVFRLVGNSKSDGGQC